MVNMSARAMSGSAGRSWRRSRPGRSIRSASTDGRVRIVSPNGGTAEWLLHTPKWATETRAAILAATRARSGALRLILGAGNDQVSTTAAGKKGRDAALSILKEAGIAFVPDPLV